MEECSSVPRMIQARPEVEFDEESTLLLLEVLLLLLLLKALDGVESRDEVGDAPGVRRVWRRRRLWRGRWIAILRIRRINECVVDTYYYCNVVLARQDSLHDDGSCRALFYGIFRSIAATLPSLLAIRVERVVRGQDQG